jgi:hypothetical protein
VGPLGVHILFPTKGSWSAGDRKVICFVSARGPGGKLTGSHRKTS